MQKATNVKGWVDPLAITDFLIDAGQRTILFWDVMRQRGNQYLDHMAKPVPHVLQYEYELVLDGREFPEPVNYGIVKIIPPKGTRVDARKRPFVIIDPRGGHGPGIGGFKADSEIGVALRAGHPCYFIGFSPDPEEGQTIDAIIRAEAAFVQKVAELHPEADGKPMVIGNCQAGWALMMLAATRPEVCGPILLAGSPVSYWAGVRGESPMRYSGGLLGGSWLTALTSDIGNGKFDSAWLVQNFENLNPANTLWTKQYNLYANIDREARRYLGFERWWGGHVFFTGEEMQYIVDNLFIGNKLSSARMVTDDGLNIDLRKIRSPIICFCSKGDNITPPPQALGWILDLYGSDDDIVECGQTIVYAVHEKTGHLGIFVSGSVTRKEHAEFTSNIDLIDCLPPGLYEAVIEEKEASSEGIDLIKGDYISRFEKRTLDDIRALGANSPEDDRCFAAVEKLSNVTHGLYRTTAQPVVKALSNEKSAEWLRRTHPLRLAYEMFSDRNPLMKPFAAAAEQVKNNRRQAAVDNPLFQWQQMFSGWMGQSLDQFRDWRDQMAELAFFSVFKNPLLQSTLGLNASDAQPRRHPGQDADHRALVERKIEDLKSRIDVGDARKAAIRALIYVMMPEKALDEREFEMILKIRSEYKTQRTLAEFKKDLREQYFILLVDERRAISAIPKMLKGEKKIGQELFEAIRRIVTADGIVGEKSSQRLSEMERLFVPRSSGKKASKRKRP